MTTGFDVSVRQRILKPLAEDFDAVVDPAKMARYCIGGASAPLAKGATVTWEFTDVGARVEIHVLTVKRNELIVYGSSALGQPLHTTVAIEADGPDAAVVTIAGSSFELAEQGVKLALRQNAGWTYTLCGLKAYVQFGINLRTRLNKRITDV